jgi:20S proteasome subunit beta 6
MTGSVCAITKSVSGPDRDGVEIVEQEATPVSISALAFIRGSERGAFNTQPHARSTITTTAYTTHFARYSRSLQPHPPKPAYTKDGDVQSEPVDEWSKLLLQPSTIDSRSRQQGAWFLPVSPSARSTSKGLNKSYRYTDNGGSTLAISGNDFSIIAGDTRSTSGYNINTRYSPKVFKIGGTTSSQDDATLVLSVVGFAADGEALKERLDAIVKMYRYQHGKPMSVKACAQRLSTILYGKRFFPYYVTAILGGLDEEGKGAVYSYDPVGSYEREQCRAAGAAASLIMPFLDNQVNFKNQYIPGSGEGHALQEREKIPLRREEVEDLVKDAFDSAVERHIEVGDGLQMLIITSKGIEEKYLPLKKD